ncbi:MAG: response regulator [Patescibacteria group bacterium]|jgi:DNA-binding response OmpR family regulator
MPASKLNKKEDGQKKSVLIIEDDVLLVQAYQIKFKKEGIDAQVAFDGREALAFLDKEPPGVVLLDLMLPGISGFTVLEEIRKNEKWKEVPVIILSNLGQTNDIERGKAMGVVDYVVKANVKINEIVEKVRKFL